MMNSSKRVAALVCCTVLLCLSKPVFGQVFSPPGQMPYASPTVSPYLNLGFNSNGVSNYQTLVKPMVEQREAFNQSTMSKLKPERPAELSKVGAVDPREQESNARPTSPKVFFNYSHYYRPATYAAPRVLK